MVRAGDFRRALIPLYEFLDGGLRELGRAVVGTAELKKPPREDGTGTVHP